MTMQRLRDTYLPRALAPLLPEAVWRGPTHDAQGHPLLYLTVDDGPHPDGTPRWLGALDRLGARAVFFVSGREAKRRPDLVRAIEDAGHRLGNHGYAHWSAWRSRPGWAAADADRVDRFLVAITGQSVRDVRPPYGRVSPGLVRWTRRTGRRLVLWDLMPGDYLPSRSPDRLGAEIVRLARPGSVVVLHDGAPAARAVAALDLALPRLAAAGWRFPALPPAR
ncbi:MAG: polysaccharide deacetylase family protein [Bacteroidota bacterium]